MADRWFYAHDTNKLGPFSAHQLRDLAVSGQLLVTDTIWKDDLEQGVLATKVKHLFPVPPAIKPNIPVESKPAATPVPEVAAAETLPDNIELQPEAKAPAKPKPTSPPAPPVRVRHAVGGKGAIIVSQDGTNVRFKKKCTTCGHEDSSWNTMPIQNGRMTSGFYCTKCRKRREVEMQGSQRS